MYDKTELQVKAGNGGDGSVSFRKESFVPYGGPDGGDGGKGGDVIIQANGAYDDLRRYRQKRVMKAENGGHGSGKKKHGRNGKDIVIEVPPGTIIYLHDEEGNRKIIADLKKDGESVIAARGGRGGQANVHFTSSVNQAPHLAQRGEAGEEATISLEMRLIADVGIIGYPNAGKSTLLSAASAAHPKIAAYPFTTLEPILGVVDTGKTNYVIAEIPGLIEGAHEGKGLGLEFLRHAMRTRIFIHLISGDAESPVDDMMSVNDELRQYDITLAARPQVVAVNKIDKKDVAQQRETLENNLRQAGIMPYFISAQTGEGVKELLEATRVALEERYDEPVITDEEVKIFRPKPRDARYRVWREETDDRSIFHVDSPEVSRLYVAPGTGPGELRKQITFQLKRMGAYRELVKLGIQDGDTVQCGEITWYW